MSAQRYPWWMGPAEHVAAGMLLLLGSTWRLERLRIRERDARLYRGERCIFALWHARLLSLVYTHRRRSVAVLVSRHRDGELIARIIARLGYVTGRGSSSRGGEEGTREMLSHAEAGHLLALTPDGPRGPCQQVKPGLVYLASRTGFPILPTAAAASHEWVLESWDRFRIPWPFTRLVYAYGDPIAVPPRLADHEIEGWRVRIESAIGDLTREVDQVIAGRGTRR